MKRAGPIYPLLFWRQLFEIVRNQRPRLDTTDQRRMEVCGFTSPKHRAALSSRPSIARSSAAAVYLSRRSGRRRTAGDGGIHQLELRPRVFVADSI